MSIDVKEIALEISGLGIVFHSPRFTQHITDGEDYFSTNYITEQQVQAHIQKGTLVGFGTGSPGVFTLRFHSGYPSDDYAQKCEFKLRLGLHCSGGLVCFRDLYELMDWRAECPSNHMIELEDGFYHVTLCSDRPTSGVIGDNQRIDFYLQKLDQFPKLANQGVPTLCM